MRNIVMVVTILLADAFATILPQSGVDEDVGVAVGAVLEATSHPYCSLILLTDGVTSPFSVFEEVSSERSSPRGVTVMEVAADGQDANVTLALLSQLVGQARQMRLRSWCMMVAVISHDPAFLAAFAESSLKGRLLVWATRLLVVTRLTLPQLHALLPSYWTFSMMNTTLLNLEDTPPNLRYRLYHYLPYSPDGAQVVRVAIWSPRRGLVLLTETSLFPSKYSNFYGAKVNVTALPWLPYWEEEEEKAPNGTVVKKYSGSDYFTLKTISETLNFVYNIVPAATWYEVTMKVNEKVAFFTAVNHMTLFHRLTRYDFSYTHEFLHLSFSMAKPGIKPRWQSLYYPLSGQVWAAMLVVLLLMPVFFYMISVRGNQRSSAGGMSVGSVVLEVTGILVGQNLPLRLPNISSSRLLLTLWLLFSFVVGTVYRGNLTAALTLPKFPPRPETLEELVETVDSVTVPTVGGEWHKFFAASESEVYRKFADLVIIGPTTTEGLLMATKNNMGQMSDRRNAALTIAKHFTRADGSTPLYQGRESILPVPAGLPVTHDAPFRPQLDRCLMAIVEAGLIKKWNEDILRETRRKGQRKQQELLAKQQQQQQQQQQEELKKETETGSSITALTLTHMQGPIMLLFFSLTVAGITFFGEILEMRYWKSV